MQQNEIDALIVSYLMDEIGEDELAILKKWAGESESNALYFDHMKELWVSAISESEKEKYDASRGYDRFKERVNTSQQRRKHHNRSKYLYPFITCCAVCAILFFIGKAIYSNSNKPLQYYYVEAPIASTASFTLPDGSSIRLNAGSRLTYDSKFGKKERLVHLEGEAYFDVKHDERKTFIVTTERMRVTDLVTSFNIKDYPDDEQSEIALVQGKVSLSTSENDCSLEMVPGEIARVENSGKTTVKKGGIESAISWISGCYLFEDESLESIAKKLERGFNVNIVIKNKNANNLKFNGYFESGSDGIDKILYTLSQTGKINYSKQNGIYYIY